MAQGFTISKSSIKIDREFVKAPVFAVNRTGILMEVTRIFTERQIDIKSVNARISKQGDRTTINVSFDTHSVSELNYLMNKLRQIEGVLSIDRTTG